MGKYKNKYRIPSARAQGWEYGRNGAYFVTICTKDRGWIFGCVENGKMNLSEAGRITNTCWLNIPDRFLYVRLGKHVIMPNHMHGIVIIRKPGLPAGERGNLDRGDRTGGVTGDSNPMMHENLSRVIRWYKGRATYEIRKNHPGFAWQARFHDRIIRNERSFRRISNYIIRNPQKWQEDRFSR